VAPRGSGSSSSSTRQSNRKPIPPLSAVLLPSIPFHVRFISPCTATTNNRRTHACRMGQRSSVACFALLPCWCWLLLSALFLSSCTALHTHSSTARSHIYSLVYRPQHASKAVQVRFAFLHKHASHSPCFHKAPPSSCHC
jgi:hypothetical protein